MQAKSRQNYEPKTGNKYELIINNVKNMDVLGLINK
jgi:hypothetical protein